MTSNNFLPAAAVFDMDGVLVDSNPFHLRKWIDLLTEHQIPFKPEDLPQQVLGLRNDTSFRFFFKSQLSAEERRRLNDELEEKFRKAFQPHARPMPGLAALIEEFDRAGVPMAVASSAMAKNVEFIVDALGIRRYFRCLVAGDEVRHAKPDPEIYLKAAEKLGVPSASCVAFEDSFVGVEAAKRAGMKCVAIATTFSPLELRKNTAADLVTRSLEDLTLARLKELFGPEARQP